VWRIVAALRTFSALVAAVETLKNRAAGFCIFSSSDYENIEQNPSFHAVFLGDDSVAVNEVGALAV
jgi:hypothetical protein